MFFSFIIRDAEYKPELPKKNIHQCVLHLALPLVFCYKALTADNLPGLFSKDDMLLALTARQFKELMTGLHM